jgi:hypothetical protein
MHKGKKYSAYGGKVKTTTISEIYKVSISVYYVSESHITQLPFVLVGQVTTERNSSLLFSGELGNDKYDAPLPAEEKERLHIFYKIILHTTFFEKNSLHSSSA